MTPIIAVVGLELFGLELVGLALSERDVSDEAVPDTIAVLLNDDDALVTVVDAEVMPVRIVEVFIELEEAELLVELLQ
jgi:hypothetical protein